MYQKCPVCKGKGLLKKETCPVCLGERIIAKDTGLPPSRYVVINPWYQPWYPYTYPSYPITVPDPIYRTSGSSSTSTTKVDPNTPVTYTN